MSEKKSWGEIRNEPKFQRQMLLAVGVGIVCMMIAYVYL